MSATSSLSFAYLVAALVHALLIDAPLNHLYERVREARRGFGRVRRDCPLGGDWRLVLPGLGRGEPGPRRLRAARASLYRLPAHPGRLALALAATGALAALYAASLAVLGVAQWISDGSVEHAFEWGHVAVTGLWGLVAICGSRRRAPLRAIRPPRRGPHLARRRVRRGVHLRRRPAARATRAAMRSSSARARCSSAPSRPPERPRRREPRLLGRGVGRQPRLRRRRPGRAGGRRCRRRAWPCSAWRRSTARSPRSCSSATAT